MILFVRRAFFLRFLHIARFNFSSFLTMPKLLYSLRVCNKSFSNNERQKEQVF